MPRKVEIIPFPTDLKTLICVEEKYFPGRDGKSVNIVLFFLIIVLDVCFLYMGPLCHLRTAVGVPQPTGHFWMTQVIIYAKLNSKAVYKKISISSNISDRKIFFGWSKSENRKVKNVNNSHYENVEIFRFWLFDFQIFRNYDRNSRFWKFSITKFIFRPESFDENRYIFL